MKKIFRTIDLYKRRIIQITIVILYNLNFAGFKNASIYKGNLKSICIPGLHCYSCMGATFACPIGSLQSYIASHKYKNVLIDKIPFYLIGVLVFFGIVFGRIVCGFLCPFGFLQELLYKIKSRKIKKNRITAKLIYIKYVILILFIIVLPICMLDPTFCKYICPSGTMAGMMHIITNESLRSIVSILFDWKVAVLLVILVMSIFMYRFFCRFICPLGAFYGLFNKVSIFGVQVDNTKCTNCNVCIKTCLMDIKKVADNECINCMDCIKKCPENAIMFCRGS